MRKHTTTVDMAALPTIALVGRVNVGKSSLFNRLIEEQKAIVSPIAGTTRTNNEGVIIWRGRNIRIIDTGGLTFVENVPFEEDIIKQSEYAMKQAQVIVFVTDATSGILPQERELAKRLRHKRKHIIVVANKADSKKIVDNMRIEEWNSLGFGEPMTISAASGRSLGDLLDVVYDALESITHELPPDAMSVEHPEAIQVSIIGKPNAGKSSLFNKLIGEEKAIVSDISHTTREPYDTLVRYTHDTDEGEYEQAINFIDTAGIRRKARVGGELEHAGISKSIESIDKCDIILFVIDGSENISHQDMQLGGLLEKHAKSVVLIVNKWDKSDENDDDHRNNVKKMVYSYFPHLSFAPIIFTSAKTGYRVHQIFPMIISAWKSRNLQISEGRLNGFLKRITSEHRPSRGKGIRHPELVGMRQIGSKPPVFEVFVKYRTSLHRSYLNFIENKLREEWDLIGTPIIIKLTKMKR